MEPTLADFLLVTCATVVGMTVCMVLSINCAAWIQRRRIAMKFRCIRKWVNNDHA